MDTLRCKTSHSSVKKRLESMIGERSHFSRHFYERGDALKGVADQFMLVMLLEGRAKVMYDEFSYTEVEGGRMFLIPKVSKYKVVFKSSSTVFLFLFDALKSEMDRDYFEKLALTSESITPIFETLPMRRSVMVFLNQLGQYFIDGTYSSTVGYIKERELFFIIRSYYTANEVSGAFYALICKNMSFRAFVLSHYAKAKCISDLAVWSNTSLSTFKRKFHENFGESIYQWMLKQKSNHILQTLKEENVTIADVVEMYEFSSASHFNRFCKKQFGETPAALRSRLRNQVVKVE